MRLCVALWTRAASLNATRDAEARMLRVAVVGTPNVGKSALTNQLVKADLCAVSKLMDTTRENMAASYSEGTCQLEVVDSPGLIGLNHAKKRIGTHSDAKILVDPEKSLERAQHMLVVCDVTAPGQYIHHRVLHMLHRNSHVPSSLVLNKCDLIKKRATLLDLAHTLTAGVVGATTVKTQTVSLGKLGGVEAPPESLSVNPLASRMESKDEKWTQTYNKVLNKPTHKCTWQETKNVFRSEAGWPHFSSVFFVSAERGDGIDELRTHLQQLSSQGEWRYESGVRTLKRPQAVVRDHIRSTLLNSLPSDVAYTLKAVIVHWDFDDENRLQIIAHVIADKERWAKMVAGVLPAQIYALEARFARLFNTSVDLEILSKFNGRIVAK